jgi:hypothetical protein
VILGSFSDDSGVNFTSILRVGIRSVRVHVYVLFHQTVGRNLRTGALSWPVGTMERQRVYRNVCNSSQIHMVQIAQSKIKIKGGTLIAKYELGIMWKESAINYFK